MDCDTTGIEPDFALVKFKKLAGGGIFQDHQPRRARRLAQRSATTTRQITTSIRLCGRPRDARACARRQPCKRSSAKGLPQEYRSPSVEAALAAQFDIRFVFNKWTLGVEIAHAKP